MSPKKYIFRWKKFLGRFIFWFLSIIINIFPIILKHFRDVTPETFTGLDNLLFVTIGDFDFLFISVSVVFILCIEGFFAEEELARIYHKFQLVAFLYITFLLILYVCFFFKLDMFVYMGPSGTFVYNSTIIILTVILGALCNITISLQEKATT